MRDNILNEKAASSELGGLPNSHKQICSMPHSFPQEDNFQRIGLLGNRIIETEVIKSSSNDWRAQDVA